MKKIYIANQFNKKKDTCKLYKLFEDKGCEISSDWTKHKPITPYNENSELAKQYSIEDMAGIKNSDIFIAISNEEGSTGVHVELGIAILSNIQFGKPTIYVIGDYISRSMFYFHPSVNRRKSIDEVLNEIIK